MPLARCSARRDAALSSASAEGIEARLTAGDIRAQRVGRGHRVEEHQLSAHRADGPPGHSACPNVFHQRDAPGPRANDRPGPRPGTHRRGFVSHHEDLAGHTGMTENDWLAHRFEEQRPRLRGVAYRLLGSLSEADDAVQEAWLRLSRADADEIDNLA